MTNAFRMTIGADRREIAGVNAAFAGFAEQHALPAAVRRSLHVALDELLTNTIDHGFVGASVEVEIRSDRVSLRLSDDGRPFDPFGLPAPIIPNPDRIGGLGIHVVRELMDEVSYERRGGRNIVVLTKLLTGGR